MDTTQAKASQPIASTSSASQTEDQDLSLFSNSDEAGITHNCGVFGCIAAGEWPTQIDVAQLICLGLVALQHR
jgi:hypothetical protein